MIFLFLIKIYQTTISPSLGENCKFFPSCSEYAKKQFLQRNSITSIFLTLWRIIRCNPIVKPQVDDVKEIFKKK
ncbi:MAG: membrane protein insertion efficiency factor YidD [Rickettsia sp.]|nr:membrane protein insertion efficiency factor YidD [Rickettsia sp.]